jgi:hypothetical protein
VVVSDRIPTPIPEYTFPPVIWLVLATFTCGEAGG